MMRDLSTLAAIVPIIPALHLTMWMVAPEHRLARSAVLAGIVVGRAVGGAAW